jgi:hypothetical protein
VASGRAECGTWSGDCRSLLTPSPRHHLSCTKPAWTAAALHNARAPTRPAALASDTVAELAAGADIIHSHPPRAAGKETLGAEDVAATVTAIHPTGVRTNLDPQRHHPPQTCLDHGLARSSGRACCASVNCHDGHGLEVAAALEKKGMGVQTGIWSAAAAREFVCRGWRGRSVCWW